MNNFKTEKITELYRELAADFLQRESNGTSLITVTRVVLSPNKKSADILLSVLPEDKEEIALEFANRQIDDFIAYVKEKARLRSLPFFKFDLDKGEKNRQKIDELSQRT